MVRGFVVAGEVGQNLGEGCHISVDGFLYVAHCFQYLLFAISDGLLDGGEPGPNPIQDTFETVHCCPPFDVVRAGPGPLRPVGEPGPDGPDFLAVGGAVADVAFAAGRLVGGGLPAPRAPADRRLAVSHLPAAIAGIVISRSAAHEVTVASR